MTTTTETAVARSDGRKPAANAKANSLAAYLESKADSLAAVIPDNFKLDTQRLIRLAISVCARTPDLLECSQASIYSSIYDAVRWGIDPVSPHGYGYLVPRWNKNTRRKEASFQVGYKGFIKLAREFGDVGKVVAEVVLHGEEFEFDPVSGTVKHGFNPDLDRMDETKYRAVYAIAWPKDGGEPSAIVMGRSQVMSRKDAGATKGGMWEKWPDRMWRKTAIRALFSGGDIELSPKMIEILEHDYAVDREENERRIEVVSNGAAAMNAALGLDLGGGDDEQGEPEPVAKLLEAELGRQQVELAEVSEHVLGRKPSSKQPLTEDEIQRIYDYMTHAEEGAAQE